MSVNKWHIPYKSKTRAYMRCWYICRRENKPWPELTEKEREKKPWDTVHPAHIDKCTESILAALDHGGAKTHADLLKETGIATRTLRYGIKKLREKGLITEKFNWKDARQTLYQQKDPVQQDPVKQGSVMV